MKEDKRIDEYIAKSNEFAIPILTHIRCIVHKACPQVEETIKWGVPHFDYKGQIMCGMAAFKSHCSFVFHKSGLIKQSDKYLFSTEKLGMGSFGKLCTVKDLPPQKVFVDYIKQVMKLNEAGIKLYSKRVATALDTPAYLLKALAKNKAAKQHFNQFPPSHKNEYIKWMEEAKTEETRQKRLSTAMDWIAQGKGRNWKYEKPKKK